METHTSVRQKNMKRALLSKFAHVLHCHIKLAFLLTVYVFGSYNQAYVSALTKMTIPAQHTSKASS